MNFLITSIGQRGYLVDHFKETAPANTGIFAADATKFAPALQNADQAFLIPKAMDADYYEKLLSVCVANNIGGIASINDLELPILAHHKEELKQHGICAVVSEPEVVDICFDKYLTYRFCMEQRIPVPKTYLWTEKEQLLADIADGLMKLPIIAKPRKGSRSVGIHVDETLEELLADIENMKNADLPEDEKLMFQEYIDSEQFSVHVFNNEELTPVTVVTMVNIFKHFGETFHIKTYRDPALTQLGIDIGTKLKHFGPLSADVHQRENGEYVVLEFNPRISGCYSLSHYAGADFTGKMIQLAMGNSVQTEKIDAFEDGVIMLKQFTTAKLSESQINAKL